MTYVSSIVCFHTVCVWISVWGMLCWRDLSHGTSIALLRRSCKQIVTALKGQGLRLAIFLCTWWAVNSIVIAMWRDLPWENVIMWKFDLFLRNQTKCGGVDQSWIVVTRWWWRNKHRKRRFVTSHQQETISRTRCHEGFVPGKVNHPVAATELVSLWLSAWNRNHILTQGVMIMTVGEASWHRSLSAHELHQVVWC